jgi:hypothetical protein
MTREIMLAVGLAWSASAIAADPGHCDSKPFTLKKPTTTTPKPAPPAVAVVHPAPKPVAPAKTADASKSKKYVLGCKQPKS